MIQRHWLFLGFLPLLLAAMNTAWLYTAPGIDAWIYYGYYFNFPRYIQYFPDAYFGSRLSIILPASAIHHLLPPIPANLILHLGLYYLAVFALYDVLKRTLNPQTAFLGAVMMGSYIPFLTAVGWNYIDGFGIPYLLLTIWCLTRASEPNYWRGWMLISGVAFGLALHSNLILCLFAPFLGGYFILMRQARQSIPLALVIALLGFLSLTLVLGGISQALGGEFAFFQPSLDFMLNRSNESGNFAGRHGEGLRAGHHLALTFAASLGAVIWLLQRRQMRQTWKQDRHATIFVGGGLLITLFYFGLEVLVYPLMSLQYYANYLLPFVFLSLSVQLFGTAARWTPRQIGVWAAWAVVGSALALMSPQWRDLTINTSQVGWGVFFSLFLASLAVMVVVWRPQNSLAWAVCCILLSAVGYRTVAKPAYAYNPPNDLTQTHQDFLLAVDDAIHLAQTYTAEEPLYMWFTNEPNTPFYAIASAHVNPNSFIGQPFGGIYPTTLLYGGQRLAILSFDGQVEEIARRELNKRGFRPEWLGEESLVYGDLPFMMSFLELQPCGMDIPPAQLDLALPSDALIFYPASDRARILEAFRADHDCWIDEAERPAHAEVAALITATQDEAALGNNFQTTIQAWRGDKNARHLAGIDYIVLTSEWRSWLSEAEAAPFDDPRQYRLIRRWDFYRAEKSYWLYAIVE